ncbi:MAG: hypothetical protein CVV24_03155 [Ignavibacteriae bacterium HGW-Ignavibacteriae-3]|nr:MAG: hypothetical protein CVV24_03155 [Ignavibacteriae bacterium HGW-Ignavibacteriae-3]
MKVFLVFLLLLPMSFINAQKIGEMAPEKPPEVFPDNSWGVDIMFTEGGFGLGTFYRNKLGQNLTGFVDFSISETKDDREINYIDYWGNSFTPNKVNRAFMLPLNFGIQYRVFSDILTENLRPHISIGVGPTILLTTPYDEEFFSAFGRGKANYAIGGYIGFGANMGTSKSNLIGLNVRYYHTQLLGDGIELMTNSFKKSFGQFTLMLTIGIMY